MLIANNVNYYMSEPIPGLDILYSDFRGSSVSQVPVLRCFGSNGNGQKICVHIHGVFPYLYIPYDGTGDADTLSYQLAGTIDKAVNISLNQGSSSTQHVYKISLVSGIPMYGYHFKKHQFFKIYLYNPMVVATVSKLLSNQSILGKVFQPHEAHINFTLQFMIDHNLHGMSNMVVDDIKYRINSSISTENGSFSQSTLEKNTTCELEADINAQNIINRREIVSDQLVANPGIAALWDDEKQRRRNKSKESQLGQFIEVKNTDISPTKSHLVYKEALLKRLTLLSSDEKVNRFEENMSVYPAETPDDVNIQNASTVDLHTPSSLEISLDDSLMQPSQNVTLFQSYINVSLNEADLSFANVLKELENANTECVEEGSILSQTVIENTEENGDSVEDLDLSMPLPEVLTPRETDVFQHTNDSTDNIFLDLNNTLIPQIDGQVDTDCVRYMTRWQMKKLKENMCCVKTGRSMPSLECSYSGLQTLPSQREEPQKQLVLVLSRLHENIKSSNKIVKLQKTKLPSNLKKTRFQRKGEHTLEDEIRLLDFRINKLNRRFKLQRIKRVVSKKEKIWSLMFQQKHVPKFSLIPGQKWFLAKRKEESVMAHILQQTRKYIDDDLHLIVEYQGKLSRKSLLYMNCDGTANTSSSEDELDVIDYHKRRSGNTVTENNVSRPFKCEQTVDITEAVSKSSNSVSKNPRKTTNSQLRKTLNQSDNSFDIFSNGHCSNALPEKHCIEIDHHTEQGCSNVFSPDSSLRLNPSYKYSLNSDLSFKQIWENIILTPKIKAPTRDCIEKSLGQYGIPHISYSGAFYGNVEDCTGSVEIGQNVLNIPSKTTAHLKEFESHNDALNKFRRLIVETTVKLNWNQNNLKKLKLNHCGNGGLIITPLKKPPSMRSVNKWVDENTNSKSISKKLKKKHEKNNFYIRNSYDSNMDSISISSCTQSQPQNSSDLFSTPEENTPNLRKSVVYSQDRDRSDVIEGVTQSSYTLQKSVENLQAVRTVVQYQFLTTVVVELHIRTRDKLNPDPEYDPICGIFYSFANDAPRDSSRILRKTGVFVINSLPNDIHNISPSILNGTSRDYDTAYADSEESLLHNFLNFIVHLDPDILAGYEVHMLSWGYLIDRARFLNISILQSLGRSQVNRFTRFKKSDDNYELETAVTGRIVLDIWRLMRHEVALQSYTFESIVYAILRRRVPKYLFQDLTQWWDYPTNLHRHRVIEYYFVRVNSVLDLFEKLDFINRTSELARLFGILFYEVLSRGSQFRVESMMLRLAKPLNYIPVSPTVMQRARMKAPEYIPLVMEPESKMYNDPVIVLDFQSLYPSIIIAYNYCFTTCMGRVECLGKNGLFEFGATQLKISKRVTEKLAKRDLINYSPCGVAFVKKELREGILPRMLKEILDTRLMVKNAMKENADNNILQKVLHNRQLGLKLIANVTYGYTAANFSGRMCCVEVGDSVVSKGRETLQRAIAMVDTTSEWGARVVYGDTDSLFVIVPGRSRKGAFEVGKKIAEAITKDNPDPIKLKLEKVYHPCILQTKKRYVGYMYENPDQTEPVYDAKGIETVRRDGCPAVSKMLEKCLRLLFDIKDVSLIKQYVLRQFNKIQSGKTSIQDLTFAKEYRGASGYKPGACVPALELARKWKLVDRRSEPRSGERVPYVIVNGSPGLPLIKLVRSPWDILNDCSLRPNALYYITKVIIPPINRCFSLIGVDVNVWFNQMPRKQTFYLPNSSPGMKTTLSQYFVNKICAGCELPTADALCQKCCQKPDIAAFTLFEKLRIWEKNHYEVNLICHSCTRSFVQVACSSLDCPVLYRRIQSHRELQQSNYIRDLLRNKTYF
ncbi:DNA polymerase zeta catalytic subunit isoform X2 [Cylas formicarius]|uniref:DNA polymerase zeta catalytic subunit isoform X2 n=1 Tax=Cylas formicarius TaxID=197179 RepID=UPI0029585AAD|nr:DNA polymerase zeta catalytic subunit isoform X2 [Cylas formicarius]